MRSPIVLMASVVTLALGGCHRLCEPRIPDRDLLAQYADQPLERVYEKHLELVSNCTPPRPTLASRLADFGPAAKTYALSRLIPGDSRSFIAARSVFSTVNAVHNVKCSDSEFAKLNEAARRLQVGEAKSIYIESVRDACRLQ